MAIVFDNNKKIDYTQVKHRKESLAALKQKTMVLGVPSEEAAVISASEEIEENEENEGDVE